MYAFSKAKWLLMWTALYIIPLISLATDDKTNTNPRAGIGLVAGNLMEPVGVLSDFVHSACFIIGGSFLFACIIKYFEHRRSPLMVPISTVVFLLIAGIILICLPFVAYITENGVHYSLMR